MQASISAMQSLRPLTVLGFDVSTRAVGISAIAWPSMALLGSTVCTLPPGGCTHELVARVTCVAHALVPPGQHHVAVVEECLKGFQAGRFHTQGLFVLNQVQGALQHALWQRACYTHTEVPSVLRGRLGITGRGGAAGASGKDKAIAFARAAFPNAPWGAEGSRSAALAGDRADALVAGLSGAVQLTATARLLQPRRQGTPPPLLSHFPKKVGAAADAPALEVLEGAWAAALRRAALEALTSGRMASDPSPGPARGPLPLPLTPPTPGTRSLTDVLPKPASAEAKGAAAMEVFRDAIGARGGSRVPAAPPMCNAALAKALQLPAALDAGSLHAELVASGDPTWSNVTARAVTRALASCLAASHTAAVSDVLSNAALAPGDSS